jgi:hypothetical protein
MTNYRIIACSMLLGVNACNGSRARTPAASTSTSPAPVQTSTAPPSSTSQPVAPQSAVPDAATVAAAVTSRTWAFDGDPAGALPTGFSFGRTGGGTEGRWVVQAEAGAPSGSHVLAQLDANDTDYRFPIAVASAPLMRDGSVSVRCKPVSGRVDQACGLVFRYRDADNYYVTRANALENNVRLYHVVKGDRRQFAGYNGRVSTGHWHSLRVAVKGDHFEVYWEDTKVIDAHDSTFSDAGKVGVWTKADSVTNFDDLRVELAP